MLRRVYKMGIRGIKLTFFFSPKAKNTAFRIFRNLFYRVLRLRASTNSQWIVFESYRGRGYKCNPRAIYEFMLSSDDFHAFTFIWAAQNPENFTFLRENPRTKIVKRNSFAYLRAYAKSKYWIADWQLQSYLYPLASQMYLNTWHGKPIKRIGLDVLSSFTFASGSDDKVRERRYKVEEEKLTHLLAPAPVFEPIMASAFGLEGGVSDSRLLKAGYPRNARLFTCDSAEINRLKAELSLPADKKIVLYAPTWRGTRYEKGVGYIYHNPLDFSFLKQELGDEYLLLFRGHNLEAGSIDLEKHQDFVRDVTDVEDVNDLYLVSDLLISDYSGTIFDFANLQRPMVYYLFDWEDYSQNQNGVYFDPHTFPGIVASKQSELPDAIRDALATVKYDEQYAAFNQKYNTWEGAHSPEAVVRQFIDETDLIKLEPVEVS